MEIDEHLWEPLQVRAHVPACLGLRQREPVSVQVEVIVIGASPGPRLVVLGGGGVRRRRYPFGDAEVMDEAIAPVRVLCGHENNEALRQNRFNDVVFCAARR